MFSPFCLLQRADSGGEGGDETEESTWKATWMRGALESTVRRDRVVRPRVPWKSPVSSRLSLVGSIQVTSDGSTATAAASGSCNGMPCENSRASALRFAGNGKISHVGEKYAHIGSRWAWQPHSRFELKLHLNYQLNHQVNQRHGMRSSW